MQESGAIFDLAFVGGGISALYTLLNLAELLAPTEVLRASSPGGRLQIAIVERTPGGLGGVPYTRRSGYSSLLITSLRDFLPDDERELFIEWLNENKHRIFALQRRHGGALSARWSQTHEQEIARGEWEDLYLPRYLFGMYMDERIHRAVHDAKSYCDVKIIQAEVTDVIREKNGFRVDLANAGSLQAADVVLAIGSNPNHAKLKPPSGANGGDACFVDDPYEPGLDCTLEQIETFLRNHSAASPNVLLIGGGASTMDVLYALTDRWNHLRPIRFSILSPNGNLPDKIERSSAVERFVPVALQALLLESDITAREIYQAAQCDIALGRSQGLTTSDTLAPISEAVLASVSCLSSAEKQEFSDVWGTALGRLQRRAGPEYSNVAAELAAQGNLTVIEGRFRQIAKVDRTGSLVEIECQGETCLLPETVPVVINCGGFAKIPDLPDNNLLRRLIHRGLVRPTANLAGLLVNDQMEASPGLFVFGPLLAHNVINGTAIWHLEHCGRISRLARELAGILGERLTRRVAVAEPARTPEGRACTPVSPTVSV